jgi:hypothetical protein
MKKLLVIAVFIASFSLCALVIAQDVPREEALKEFDDEVNGARTTTNTVPPLTHRQLEDTRCTFCDDPCYWGDPFFGPGDEMDYELWRSEHDD